MHAKMMMINPVIFTFMLGRAPVGLVIYYILSNTISIVQQRALRWLYRGKQQRGAIVVPDSVDRP
jgi:YidC/Oxa1 family membrane protein insertase